MVITTVAKLTALKVPLQQQFTCMGIVHANWGTYGLLVLMLNNPTRISTIANFMKKNCTVSVYVCRGVKKGCMPKLRDAIYGREDIKVEEDTLKVEATQENKQFCYALINSFAEKKKIKDALMLLAIYKRFSTDPETCQDCKQQKANTPCGRLKRKWIGGHCDDHVLQHNNAKIFIQMKDQKRVCQGAVDIVLAEARYRALTSTRNEQLMERMKEVMESVKEILHDDDDTDELICAILILGMIIPDVDCIGDILQTLVENPPKRRYFVFRGPVNSGKTTVAAAFLNLCGGTSLNINGCPDRLPFELGCAIDCFMVLFEDVMGSAPEGSKLKSGIGVRNLDSLRDHLEGSVPVNLEKKHQNKVSQIFPPGIITMNDYILPQTIYVRCRRVISFHRSETVRKALLQNERVRDRRWLTRAETLLSLLLLYLPRSSFKKELLEEIDDTLRLLQLEFDRRCTKYTEALYEGKCVWEEEQTNAEARG